MNFDLIDDIQQFVDQDDILGGMMRPWTRTLPLRMQGVLLTALRGCDTATKEDHSKRLVAMIRRACTNPVDPRESLNAGGFYGFNRDKLKESLREFLHSIDHYPTHYILHLTHACEVIGYYHPDIHIGAFFYGVYLAIVKKMHMNPETSDQLMDRLTEDRVAKGTVERDY